MKKKILPIPLILLIPIVMLFVVIVAGIYRFSLSDEEILAKFPSSQVSYDPVVENVFDLKRTNPWTIKVPETNAYAFINEVDEPRAIAFGRYDSGVERGVVTVDTKSLSAVTLGNASFFVAPMWISNQGSGVFYYLGLFKHDQQRSRVVLVDQFFLGDRVQIQTLDVTQQPHSQSQKKLTGEGFIGFTQHSAEQSFAEAPSEKVLMSFSFDTQSIGKQ
ncbi:conserved hypothetical protein [Vibrio crassostreae]|uniref:hypothetical protein n=1 Tax=Vibrio crassostreae TaxID=246167 RepID=UPI0005E8D35B|nr:hypothetical protein [Vibrio crassostreae]TCT66174.1 hypothetical protein EDB44_102230 [Vibrio crassostreae]TCT86237.1 hypothetical protein EDB43_102230 [Vibrio crassostreae]TCU08860.1 hypothetical protein EDB47_101173 [Vibrio crassostreae]TDW11586.1 hypothetical protein EDB45_103172 [Vibrio crassostreae]CAK1772302.1 conserved hypothetical protein [Vibrio crassostreae]